MFYELNDSQLLAVDGGNIADKISGGIKVVAGACAVVLLPDPIGKVAGVYAVLDGIADINK